MEECKNHNIIKIQVCLDKEIKFVLDNSLEFFIGLDADSCDTPEAFSLQSAENNIYMILDRIKIRKYNVSKSFREEQKKLVNQGKNREALAIGIKDVRSQFSSKYNKELLEAIDSTKNNQKINQMFKK